MPSSARDPDFGPLLYRGRKRKPTTNNANQPAANSQGGSTSKAEPKIELKAEPKTTPNTDPKTEPKTTPKTESKIKPETEPTTPRRRLGDGLAELPFIAFKGFSRSSQALGPRPRPLSGRGKSPAAGIPVDSGSGAVAQPRSALEIKRRRAAQSTKSVLENSSSNQDLGPSSPAPSQAQFCPTCGNEIKTKSSDSS